MNINRFSFVKFNSVINEKANKNLNVQKKASNAKKIGEKYTTQALGEEGGNRVIKDEQTFTPKVYKENVKNPEEAKDIVDKLKAEGTPAPKVYLDSAQEGKKIQGTPGPGVHLDEGQYEGKKIQGTPGPGVHLDEGQEGKKIQGTPGPGVHLDEGQEGKKIQGTPGPGVHLDEGQEGEKIQGTPGPNLEGKVNRVKIDASNRELPTIDFDYTGYVKISKHIPKFNPKETTTMALGEEGGSKYPNLSEY